MAETPIIPAQAASRPGFTGRTACEMARAGKPAGAIEAAGSRRVSPERPEARIDASNIDAGEVAGATGKSG